MKLKLYQICVDLVPHLVKMVETLNRSTKKYCSSQYMNLPRHGIKRPTQ